MFIIIVITIMQRFTIKDAFVIVMKIITLKLIAVVIHNSIIIILIVRSSVIIIA